MIRMLIIGYCYGLRSERRLTQEVELLLAYRWFCRLDLNDKVPHHSYACGVVLCSMLVIRSISSLWAPR